MSSQSSITNYFKTSSLAADELRLSQANRLQKAAREDNDNDAGHEKKKQKSVSVSPAAPILAAAAPCPLPLLLPDRNALLSSLKQTSCEIAVVPWGECICITIDCNQLRLGTVVDLLPYHQDIYKYLYKHLKLGNVKYVGFSQTLSLGVERQSQHVCRSSDIFGTGVEEGIVSGFKAVVIQLSNFEEDASCGAADVEDKFMDAIDGIGHLKQLCGYTRNKSKGGSTTSYGKARDGTKCVTLYCLTASCTDLSRLARLPNRTRCVLRQEGRDAYSTGTDAFSTGTDAYSTGTDANGKPIVILIS